jgi:hypothetical protein
MGFMLTMVLVMMMMMMIIIIIIIIIIREYVFSKNLELYYRLSHCHLLLQSSGSILTDRDWFYFWYFRKQDKLNGKRCPAYTITRVYTNILLDFSPYQFVHCAIDRGNSTDRCLLV